MTKTKRETDWHTDMYIDCLTDANRLTKTVAMMEEHRVVKRRRGETAARDKHRETPKGK